MADNSKDHVAGLAIQIPESFIEKTIMSQIVKSIPNPEAWVEMIVKKAMDAPSTDTYRARRGETLFGAAIEAMIRDTATEIFREWIKEHQDQIRAALIKQLSRGKAKRISEIAAKLANGMSRLYVNSVHLKIGDDIGDD